MISLFLCTQSLFCNQTFLELVMAIMCRLLVKMSDKFIHKAQLCAICYCPHLPKQTNIVKPQKVLSSAAKMHGMNVPWDCSTDEVVDQCVFV